MARKRMGDTRRRQILDGLLEAFAKRGLQNCNMSDVAEAAGVSRGILHYYFKNKHEMIGALVAHLRDSNLMEFKSSMDEIDDPLDRLKASLWYPIQAFGPSGAALARVWIEFWGLAAHHSEVQKFILDVQGTLRDHFRQIVELGLERKEFLPDIHPERTASIVLAALEGLVLQWHFNQETFSFIGEIKVLEVMLERYLKPSTLS
ncbi:MAG TPA: TetR/AcrR family transcriptional regulator [Myxococcota bacterium]|nr:TetR/AcrR family transcriptional regulator [Myxococcota bacterium]